MQKKKTHKLFDFLIEISNLTKLRRSDSNQELEGTLLNSLKNNANYKSSRNEINEALAYQQTEKKNHSLCDCRGDRFEYFCELSEKIIFLIL
jgi:hypothetical protein